MSSRKWLDISKSVSTADSIIQCSDSNMTRAI